MSKSAKRAKLERLLFSEDVYKDNEIYRKYLRGNYCDTQIYYGGAGSGKSMAIADELVRDMVLRGRNYLVARGSQRSVRDSTFEEIKKAISRYSLDDLFEINRQKMTFTCKVNGSVTRCIGLNPELRDSMMSITLSGHSYGWDFFTDLWVEEATDVDESSFDAAVSRLRGKLSGDRPGPKKRVKLSFNPVSKHHWIYARYFQGRWDELSGDQYQEFDVLLEGAGGESASLRLSILKTTYRDNEYLDSLDVARLMSSTDERFRDIYLNGNWGSLGDKVYSYELAERGELGALGFKPDYVFYGSDYGYRDPFTLVRVYVDSERGMIYVDESLSHTELLEHEMARMAESVITRGVYGELHGYDVEIVCDSASLGYRRAMSDLGLNPVPVNKGGAGAKFESIMYMKSFGIYVNPSCKDVIRELDMHEWAVGSDGKKIDKVVDEYDHTLDAIRYVLMYYRDVYDLREKFYGA